VKNNGFFSKSLHIPPHEKTTMSTATHVITQDTANAIIDINAYLLNRFFIRTLLWVNPLPTSNNAQIRDLVIVAVQHLVVAQAS